MASAGRRAGLPHRHRAPARPRTRTPTSPRSPLFAVADGMGGAQAGEVASRIAAEAFEPGRARRRARRGLPALGRRGREPPDPLARAARRVALGHGHHPHRRRWSTATTSASATSATAAPTVFRDGELRLLTADHSLVEELRRQGKLTDEQAEDHPQRSIITRALGPEPEVEVDTMTYRAKPGDVYLLCSDGLTTMVKDDADRRDPGPRREPRRGDRAGWSSEANEAGGRDNITVVLSASERARRSRRTRRRDPGRPHGRRGGPHRRGRPGGGRARAREPGGAASAPPRAAARRPRSARAPRSRPGRGPVLGGIVAAAILGARQVYFLGSDEGGRLALYRGLPYDLPLGSSSTARSSRRPIRVQSLPEDRRDGRPTTSCARRTTPSTCSTTSSTPRVEPSHARRTAKTRQGSNQAGGGHGQRRRATQARRAARQAERRSGGRGRTRQARRQSG